MNTDFRTNGHMRAQQAPKIDPATDVILGALRTMGEAIRSMKTEVEGLRQEIAADRLERLNAAQAKPPQTAMSTVMGAPGFSVPQGPKGNGRGDNRPTDGDKKKDTLIDLRAEKAAAIDDLAFRVKQRRLRPEADRISMIEDQAEQTAALTQYRVLETSILQHQKNLKMKVEQARTREALDAIVHMTGWP